MKVSELQGAALALWVAKALGYELATDLAQIGEAAAGMRSPVFFYSESGTLGVAGEGLGRPWRPHEDWAQGGPILDIMLLDGFNLASNGRLIECSNMNDDGGVRSRSTEEPILGEGETTLPAICRAFIARKYGAEVSAE